MKKRSIEKGKEFTLSREEFYDFAIHKEVIHRLYINWVKSNFDYKLSPSVDRIDHKKWYTLDNIQFLTHSENARKGSYEKPKRKTSQKPPVIKKVTLYNDSESITFNSIKEAAIFLKMSSTTISHAIYLNRRLQKKKWCVKLVDESQKKRNKQRLRKKEDEAYED
jgi:hypothetical protein